MSVLSVFSAAACWHDPSCVCAVGAAELSGFGTVVASMVEEVAGAGDARAPLRDIFNLLRALPSGCMKPVSVLAIMYAVVVEVVHWK